MMGSRDKIIANHDNAMQKRKIHEWYIGGIGCCLVIMLLTYNFGNNEKLTDYVSFALTISSILLAMVAIGISVLGNSNLDQRFGELKNLNAEMRESSEKIVAVSESLANKLPEISESLSAVRERTEETNSLFKQSMSSSPANGARVENVNVTEVLDVVGPQEGGDSIILKVDNFFDISSWTGRFFLYVVAKRHEQGKKINARAFAKYLGSGGDDYHYGFQVASVSAGVINVLDDGEILSPPKWNSIKIYEYMQQKIVEHGKKENDEADRNFTTYLKNQITKSDEFSELSDEDMGELLRKDDGKK